MRSIMMDYRSDISSSIARITKGVGLGENGAIIDGQTLLAEFISRGDYLRTNKELMDRLINDPFQVEK